MSTPRATPEPSRPRLSERALPRLHFADGRCRVLVHDIETGDAFAIDPRAWVLLASADGTRDVDGVLLAAARDGAASSRDELLALLSRIAERGMLAEGPPPREAPAPRLDPASIRDRDARPIERLPGYAFHCDGRGACCRLYSTIVFSRLESAKARAVRPDVLDAGDRHEHAFTPERGAGPCVGSAVALVNGGCAYLEGSRCGLHRAGGPTAKPVGCNVFPLSLVDDGRRVRASVLVECGCVIASATRHDGAPLLPDHVRTRADLDASLVVEALPTSIEITPGALVDRDAYLTWSDAALAALPASIDAAIAASSLASALASIGLDPEAARAAIDAPPAIDLSIIAAHVAALGALAAQRQRSLRSLLDDRDLRRRASALIAASATLLADRDVLAAVASGAGARPIDESLYLRAALFGHQIARTPLVLALRDRAVAIWIARVLPLAADALFGAEHDPAFDHPLALVEAALRGHGLRRYLDHLDRA